MSNLLSTGECIIFMVKRCLSPAPLRVIPKILISGSKEMNSSSLLIHVQPMMQMDFKEQPDIHFSSQASAAVTSTCMTKIFSKMIILILIYLFLTFFPALLVAKRSPYFLQQVCLTMM